LKKFKAIKYSNKIRYLKGEIDNRSKLLGTNESKLNALSKTRDGLIKEIEEIEQEKSSFMSQVDGSNKSKAQIDTKLTNVIYQIEREKAVTKEAQLRMASLEERLSFIQSEGKKIGMELENSSKALLDKKSITEKKRFHLAQLKNDLVTLNIRIEEISGHVDRNRKLMDRLFQKKSRLVEISSRLNILIARLEEQKKFYINKINENNPAIEIMKRSLNDKAANLKDSSMHTCYSELDTEKKLVNDLRNKSKIYSNEIDLYKNTVNKVQKFAMPYEEKYSVAVQLSNEDFAIADLIKDSQDFKILGMVRDLIKYDDVYKKAVFAAAKDWMKCCIVPTVKEMIRLASYIKEKNLPCFKIISSELLSSTNKEHVVLKDHDFIGKLADLVQSSIPNLVDFIFGNVLVVRNSKTAYDLSNQGYKCVTIAGELFEPHASSLSLEFGSKISDLTHEIILNESIGSLLKNSLILSTYLANKKGELERINKDISNKELRIRGLETLVTEKRISVNHLNEATASLKNEIDKLEALNRTLSGEITAIDTELTKNKKRDNIVSSSLVNNSKNIQYIVNDKIDKELSELTYKKNEILRKIENCEIELREIITSTTSLENGINAAGERKNEILSEKESLEAEQIERRGQKQIAGQKLEQLEKELICLREEEQKIIDVSGNSYSILQTYEKQIKTLDEKERQKYREINGIEKESIAIKKDISNFTAQESQATNDLMWLGFKELLEG
ncbi:MAG TPA: hypothetical protein VNB67_04160, partial [Nitrososphaeraceae archaeon]|nr:hypothetical protein [Nitrososphaeraceae archaeon]